MHKTIKVEPKDIDGVSNMQGHVELKIPPYVERLKMIQDNKLADEKVDPIEKSRVVVDVVTSHVGAVDIKLSNGEHVTDITELGYYREGVTFINGLSHVLMNGAALSDDAKKN
jgi:hypothetical protein